jgi:hypothetical protein
VNTIFRTAEWKLINADLAPRQASQHDGSWIGATTAMALTDYDSISHDDIGR